MAREGPLRAPVVIVCPFPSPALLPATLENALLELLVTATKTYTKQQSLEVLKKKTMIKRKELLARSTGSDSQLTTTIRLCNPRDAFAVCQVWTEAAVTPM